MEIVIRVVAAVWALSAMVALSGCGLIGIKEVDLWGAKMKFSQGLNFNVGGNQVDKVDDRKGLNKF